MQSGLARGRIVRLRGSRERGRRAAPRSPRHSPREPRGSPAVRHRDRSRARRSADRNAPRVSAQLADRRGQRLDDRMTADSAAVESGGDVLAPPLQPDLAEHRLGDALAHPCNLVVEGVKREQRLATRGRCKQRRLKPVAVVAPHQRRDRRQAIRFSGTSLRDRRFSTDLCSQNPGWSPWLSNCRPCPTRKMRSSRTSRRNDGFPSRQAPPSLRHQPQQPGQGLADGEPVARGDHQGHLQGLVEDRRLQQRRASVEPHLLLELHEAERRRRAERRGRPGDRPRLRRSRQVQGAIQGGRGRPVRQRLGLARRRRRQAQDHRDAKRGQSAGRRARRRC